MKHHRAVMIPITIYEAVCDDCDWSITFSAGDPDNPGPKAAYNAARKAAAEHRALPLVEKDEV